MSWKIPTSERNHQWTVDSTCLHPIARVSCLDLSEFKAAGRRPRQPSAPWKSSAPTEGYCSLDARFISLAIVYLIVLLRPGRPKNSRGRHVIESCSVRAKKVILSSHFTLYSLRVTIGQRRCTREFIWGRLWSTRCNTRHYVPRQKCCKNYTQYKSVSYVYIESRQYGTAFDSGFPSRTWLCVYTCAFTEC
ncbi:hypothetical protein BDV33DRAFT_165796 [Aspergillus novoparasiticus]|uniref:Uncharacterized protein n=1 Tax=Aspergillus novoparasiticus TaxID=986946 RepID=A0A5N6F4F4_9EURO|nr:hypothetical protein BDV33DRAFT_165796 [Aspergillus novoparasiticus]